MSNRALVLDANILIRAVLGIRVRRILEDYVDSVSFFVPESALSEAQEHLAALVTGRGGDPAKALRLLDATVGPIRGVISLLTEKDPAGYFLTKIVQIAPTGLCLCCQLAETAIHATPLAEEALPMVRTTGT